MRSRRSIKLVIVLAAGLFPSALPAQTPPDLHAINMANFFPVVREQVEKAFQAAQANPKSADASGALGMILDTYEQYDSAAICYQRARLLDPIVFRWVYYLGWVQAAQGRFGEAEATLREALHLNRGYLPAQLRLAETLLAAGKWEESGRIYESLARRYPGLPEAYYGLGRVRSAQGDHSAAVESLRRACELFPPYGAAHYALAIAYRRTTTGDQARQHFKLYEQNRTATPGVEDPLRAAVADLNRGPLGHMRRGAMLEEAGKTEEALAEQEQALAIDPSLVQIHINLIGLYGRLGQYQKAEEHYRKAVSLNPNQAEAYYNYGVLLRKQGKDTDAQQAFEKAVQINPFFAEAHNGLGVLLERQGQLDEAALHFEQALRNRPNYPLAHFHLGRILVNRGNFDQAIEHFLKTLEPEDENTPGYLYALGATYARAGNLQAALKYLRSARERASARGQSALLRSIERDLETLEKNSE